MKKIYKKDIIIKIIVHKNNNLYDKYYYYFNKCKFIIIEVVFLFKKNNV